MMKSLQTRILNYLIMGYGGYQFLRLNINLIMPVIKEEMHFSNSQIGLVFMVFNLVYGASRLINGVVVDRMDPRLLLFVGLLGACVCNIAFSLSDLLSNFILFWGLNAFFQSLGVPACARLLKHTVDKRKYGTYWAIWSINNPVASGLVFLFLSYGLGTLGWRMCNAILVVACGLLAFSLYLYVSRMDLTFQYAGKRDKDSKDPTRFLSYFQTLYRNKHFMRVCFATFCLYAIRVGLFTWLPEILLQVKGANLKTAGLLQVAFEVGALAGGLLAGWITDRYFQNARGAVGSIYMYGIALVLAALWFLPIEHQVFYTISTLLFGFLVFGPSVLAGVSALDHASHKTVGIATGTVSIFGSWGGAFISWILGPISDYVGWGWGFLLTVVIALLGGYLFWVSGKVEDRASAA